MSIVKSLRGQLAPIHPEGYLFVVGFAVATLILWWLWSPLGWLGLVATLWCAYFFRDPARVTPVRGDLVVAPADGVVSFAGFAAPPPELGLGMAPMQRVSIFMSIFDCHVNRAPVQGRVAQIVYHPGLFLNADLDKASEDNERNSIVIDAPSGRFGVVQIAGLVARRIVCFTHEGALLSAGERIGLIRFGSRVDVYLPPGAQIVVGVDSRADRGRDSDRARSPPTPRRRPFSGAERVNEAGPLPRAPIADAPPPRRRRLRAVPLRLLIPNIVTLFALGLGLTAIRLAMEGSIDWAVSAIAGAAVLDGLDGRIARALKGTSRFGAELDSLADFVDFGVAPALVLYVANLHAAKNFGWVAALLFAMACALRLARFNVMIDEDQPAWRKTFFVGMPAPAGAIVGLLPIYLHYAFNLGPPTSRSGVIESLYVLGVALLMASRVPHFSGKSLGRVPREYVAVVLVGVAAALLHPVQLSDAGPGRCHPRLSRLDPVRGQALSGARLRGAVGASVIGSCVEN